MRVIAILFFGLLLIACNTKDSPKVEPVSERNVNNDVAVLDSATIRQQDTAISDILFGIGEKEFSKKRQSFLKRIGVKKWENSNLLYPMLGDYEVSDALGSFENDSLYSVTLRGVYISYEDYDRDMLAAYRSILSILKEKYGKPKVEIMLPDWSILDKGKYIDCAKWENGDKKIFVSVNGKGIYYTLDVDFFRQSISDRVLLKESDKSASQREDAVKAL